MMATNRTSAASFLKSSYPWVICSIVTLFYCFNFFLRSSPTVMQNELMQSFHMTGYEFGVLTSAYYWAYTPMQIPAGLIYDKFGVRFVLWLASLVATIGVLLFVQADSFSAAWTGRFLIGLGCAFAYIGILKLASVMLPANRFAIVAGLATAAGMATGALTQNYITHVIGQIGYKGALHPAVYVGIVLSFLILIFVRDRDSNPNAAQDEMREPMDARQLLKALKLVFTNKQMWLIGIIGCLLYLPASVFLDGYSKQYLITVYHITAEQAAFVASLTFLGWIISGPIIGAFSDYVKRRCLPLTITGTFAAILLCVVFYAPTSLHLWGLYATFFFIGFSCGAHPLCFPLGKENNPIQISGTAIAVTNMLIMLGGNIFPPVVGKLLDLHATTIGTDGLPIYTASDYTFALSIIPVGVAIGIFLSIFLKETYCESQATEESEEMFRNPVLQTESAGN